jgi:hypothetical protein
VSGERVSPRFIWQIIDHCLSELRSGRHPARVVLTLVDHRYPPAVTCLLAYHIEKEKKAKERKPYSMRMGDRWKHRLNRAIAQSAGGSERSP